MKTKDYHEIIVESYTPASTAGKHGPIHIRPIKGQPFSQDIEVECSKILNEYPIGTKFKIKAKLTDRKGGGQFLYSYYGWKFEVVK